MANEPEIIEDQGLNLVFTDALPRSKWRDLLNNLASRSGAVLRVDNKPNEVQAVRTAARKLGLRIQIARNGASVYVKVAGAIPIDPKEVRRKNILEALADAPRDAGQVAQYLRGKGDNVTDASMCDVVLMQLSKLGKVELGKDKKWRKV